VISYFRGFEKERGGLAAAPLRVQSVDYLKRTVFAVRVPLALESL
jgi:hypothetical protein